MTDPTPGSPQQAGAERPFADRLMDAIRSEPPQPFLFDVGDSVWVYKSTLEDGQTPRFWVCDSVKVVSRRRTMLLRDPIYTLRHANGAEDVFNEDELYQRGRNRGVAEGKR